VEVPVSPLKEVNSKKIGLKAMLNGGLRIGGGETVFRYMKNFRNCRQVNQLEGGATI
jgi:hypothetical protein